MVLKQEMGDEHASGGHIDSGPSWFYWRFGDDKGGVAYNRDGRVTAIHWLNNIY